MRHSFSLATLLLLIAIAGLGLASIRAVTYEAAKDVEVFMIGGGICGLIFGVALTIWNRDDWARLGAHVAGGIFLGVAAGAQMCVKVSWPVMFSVPIVFLALIWGWGVVSQQRRSIKGSPVR